MSDERTRFTIYAVARETKDPAGRRGIPFAHAATEDEATAKLKQLDGDRKCHPTRIVERRAAYPFEEVRVVWER